MLLSTHLVFIVQIFNMSFTTLPSIIINLHNDARRDGDYFFSNFVYPECKELNLVNGAKEETRFETFAICYIDDNHDRNFLHAYDISTMPMSFNATVMVRRDTSGKLSAKSIVIDHSTMTKEQREAIQRIGDD